MKKSLLLMTALMCTMTAWGQSPIIVSTDGDLRNAIKDGANIKLGDNIALSNSTLSIPEGTTVTIDLDGYLSQLKRQFLFFNKGLKV